MFDIKLITDCLKLRIMAGMFAFFTFSLVLAGSNLWAETDSAKEEHRKRGEKAYRKYCSACHGKTGVGDGPGAVISGIPPADLTNKAYMSLFSENDLVMRIRYGEERFPEIQMAGAGNKVSTQTIWNIVDYIRSLEIDKGPLKGLTPKERADRFKNPMERGRIYYLRYCSPCHGVSGDGKGWAARTIEGTPVAHNDPIIMARFTRQQIYDHIKGLQKKKDRKMPVFGKSIVPQMVKVIAAYTKTLSGNLQK